MKRFIFGLMIIAGIGSAVLVWSGMLTVAEARRGRPATPVSYAGVARRSTVGAGAPGVGVQPANQGGPVNRVGRR